MLYLTEPEAIKAQIARYAQTRTLWVDTELVNYRHQKLRLSLIQVSDDPADRKGDRVAMLDVMDQAELTELFVEQIMANPAIEKVFHNADYDVRFLGQERATNITCTWKMAQQIPHYLLPVSNLKLKTLAVELCHFANLPEGQQRSDWGQRPLSEAQLYYAMMDPVYLAQVHGALLALVPQIDPDPATEDLAALAKRYLEVEPQGRSINSELLHLQERIQKAMQVLNLTETEHLKLSSQVQLTVKADFNELARLTQSHDIELDLAIALPREVRKQLRRLTNKLPLVIEENTNWQLTIKHTAPAPDASNS